MNNYDILRETWIYAQIQQEVRQEERKQYISEQRQMLLEIVRARFPRISQLVERVTAEVTELDTLKGLLVKIGSAHTEKEARTAIPKSPT